MSQEPTEPPQEPPEHPASPPQGDGAIVRPRRRPAPPPHALVQKLAAALGRLVLPDGPWVVAVSGGADSVALLRAVVTLRPPASLVAAHLNHGLRGADADADAAFVAALAGRLGVPARLGRADVRAWAERERANLEDAARRVRYDWLAGVAAEGGSAVVLTAHTADDQAETVLHRLIRGTGLRGLRGIAERRPLRDGVEVVRPLLGVTRAEVEDYLGGLGERWRDDATNADPAFTRSRIRHELLPHLRAFNPAIAAVLSRLAGQAAEAFELEGAQAREVVAAAELPRAGSVVVLDAARLGAFPPAAVRAAVRAVWEREGWPVSGMFREHWERVRSVAAGGATACDLPGGVRAERAGRVVRLARLG